MSSVTVGRLPDGREIHRLVERTPLRFITLPQTPRAPTTRRTREARVGDYGAIVGLPRRSTPMRKSTHTLMEAALWAEGVPVAGFDNGHLHAGGLIGVPEEMFRRRAYGGADMTAALRESGVPLVPKHVPERRRQEEDMSHARWGDEDEAEGEDGGASELYASGEDEDEAGEALISEEVDPEDAWASFVQEVSESTDTAAKGLALLARALRQRRAAIGAAGGLFD